MIQKRTVIRSAIAALSLSAAGFVTIINDESFAPVATIPTKNDRPTNCFGMTWNPDGSPVKLGDKCTPVEGIKRSLAHIAKDERGLKACVKAPLSQVEYDILVDFSYQYGVYGTCKSGMVKNINLGRYEASCRVYTEYRKAGGYDCSTMIKDKWGKLHRNKQCWGVWARNLERQDKCLKESS